MAADDRAARSDGVDPELAHMLAAGGGELDPPALIAEINRRAGCALTLTGVADMGESGGALYVRWPDGRDAVVTRSPGPLPRMEQTAAVLADARAAGLPVPRHELVVELANGVIALVQERLPGAPAARVDADVIDAMVATNERFAGFLSGRPDVPVPPMGLRPDGPQQAKHRLLEEHGPRTRRLLQRIHEIGAADTHEMSGVDLLHPDYTFGNVLYDESGRVTGVVDWNWGAGRGDRHFALVRIYIDLFWSTLAPHEGHRAAMTRLNRIVDERVDPQLRLMYWANLTLGQLSFWIRENQPRAVELFSRFGEFGLYRTYLSG